MVAITSSTSRFYDQTAAAMSALSAQSDAINTQISTGKKLSAPSDDVVAYQRLQGMAVQTADSTAAQANITTAQNVITSAGTALTSMTTELQRASDLATQARTGTLNDADRASIATELSSIADELTALANGKDQRGQPLFAASGQAVTTNADGTHTLATTATSAIPIGDGQSVQPSASAAAVLSLPGGGNAIDMISQLAATLQAGGDVTDAVGTAMDQITTASDQISGVQASLGARGARLDVETSRLTSADTDREAARSSLEDTDMTTAITQLQKTMTVLQATQASFTKLSSLSLFDYLK